MIDTKTTPILLLLGALCLAPLALLAERAAGLDQAAVESSQEAAESDQKTAGARLETLPVEQIRRGQAGYGLTVFAGREPERFDVEIIGVLRNTDPKASYVLARLTGHGLEESGVARGMSGSPVFIDDRLIGAVAFAWPFASEAIAGITPIASMRSIQELPSGIPAPPDPVPVPGAGGSKRSAAEWSPDLASLAAGELPGDLVEHTLGALRPQMAGAAPGARPAVGWVTSGFGETARNVLADALGSVAPTGAAAPGDAAPVQTGGPIAAVLVDGDLQLAATGTITERHGDEVLAFGHAFLGLGPLSVPMASAEVLTVLPSRYNSFKISNLGTVVGAFEQDAQTGIRGRLGLEAPMIPYTLRVEGLREREYHMRMASLPQLVPALVAAATVGGLDAATFSGGPQGIDLDATISMAEWGDLRVRQSFDGPGAANFAARHLVAIASFLVQNPYQEVDIEGIDVTLHQSAKPRLATLVGAHAERTVVRPGDLVRINLELKGYRGETFHRAAQVRVPEDLSAGQLFLMVGDGSSADAARLTIEPVEPVTFGQALETLRSFHSNKELVVLQVIRASGLSVAGNTLPRLPGSVQSIWKAAASESARPLALAVTPVEVGELPFPVEGLVRIDLEVRRREPMPAGGAEGGEGESPEAPETAEPGEGPEAGAEEEPPYSSGGAEPSATPSETSRMSATETREEIR